jgi:hypothetical protein
VFGPQSYVIFAFFVAVFAAGIYLQWRSKYIVVRVAVAAISFVAAALFGMATVNRFYDYYQTWGNIVADITGTQPGVIARQATAGHRRTHRGRKRPPDQSRPGRAGQPDQ